MLVSDFMYEVTIHNSCNAPGKKNLTVEIYSKIFKVGTF